MTSMKEQQLKAQCRILLEENHGIKMAQQVVQRLTLDQMKALLTIVSLGKPDLEPALEAIKAERVRDERPDITLEELLEVYRDYGPGAYDELCTRYHPGVVRTALVREGNEAATIKYLPRLNRYWPTNKEKKS